MTLTQIQNVLGIFKGTTLNQYREIIEGQTFFPQRGTIAHYEDLKTIMMLYKANDAKIMLSLGTPIPYWWNPDLAATNSVFYPGGGRTCWIPPLGTEAWNKTKQNFAQSLASLVKSLSDDTSLNSSSNDWWLSRSLTIDPFNELDGNQVGGPNGGQDGGNCLHGGSGQHGAELTTEIQRAFAEKGLTYTVTMPSYAMGQENYVRDFYAYGGRAPANVHYYPQNETGSDQGWRRYAQGIANYLKQIQPLMPPEYRNNIILGEFMAPTTEDPAAANGLAIMLGHGELASLAQIRMVWLSAYSEYGLADIDGRPKQALFKYLLDRENIDLTQNSRLNFMRSTISVPAGTNARAVDLILYGLIHNLGTKQSLTAKYSSATANDHVTLIASYYPKYLGRASDTGGLGYYVDQALAGLAPASIADELANSAEAKIRGFYMTHLQREPDPDGMRYWLGEFNSGRATLAQIQNNIRLASDCQVNCL